MGDVEEVDCPEFALANFHFTSTELLRGGPELNTARTQIVGRAAQRTTNYLVRHNRVPSVSALLRCIEQGLGKPQGLPPPWEPSRLLSGYDYMEATAWLLQRQDNARYASLSYNEDSLQLDLIHARRRVAKERAALRKCLAEIDEIESAWENEGGLDRFGHFARRRALSVDGLRDWLRRDCEWQSRLHAAYLRLETQEDAVRTANQEFKHWAPVRSDVRRRHLEWIRIFSLDRKDDETRRALYEEYKDLVPYYETLKMVYSHSKGAVATLSGPAAAPEQSGGPDLHVNVTASDRDNGKDENEPERVRCWVAVQKHIRAGRDGPLPILECSMCLEEITLSASLLPLEDDGHAGVRLLCDHIFGRSCLARWQGDKVLGECPLCRQDYNERTLPDWTLTRQELRVEFAQVLYEWLTRHHYVPGAARARG